MGLAASQARYLTLTARMNNIEYEGQQINQARTTLSQQTNAYYASLLDMSVPVPPSTNAFTKTTYTFTLGTDTMTISSVKPNGAYYTVNATYKESGHYLEKKGRDHVKKEHGEYKTEDGLQIRKLSEVNSQMTTEQCSDYLTAVRNYFPAYADYSDADLMNEVYVYFTQDSSSSRHSTPHFIMSWEGLGNLEEGQENYFDSYDYMLNGTYDASKIFTDVKITFDSSGKISEIWLAEHDELGNIIRTVKYPVNASTSTDNAAYDEAYSKYEYDKYLYDKKMQELNAKTSIIQAEDKSLELKLTRLDNERNAISKELEAVKKVIEDNIDKSFKVFGG